MSRDFFLGVYSNGGRVWRWALFIVLCALVLSGWRLRMDNSPEIWLPSGDPEVELYDRFKDHFGNDSFVAVVSQKFDPKSTELALELGGRLEALEGVASLQSPFAEDGALKDDVLSQRLIGADGQRFAFLVALPVGADPGEILRLLERMESLLEEYPQFGSFSLVGTEVVTRDLNRGSEKSFGGLFPLVAVVLAALVWLAFRSVRLVAAIFLAVGFSVVAALGCMGLAGATLNLLVVLMPAILVVLTVAASVHLCSRYLDLAHNSSQSSLEDRLGIWAEAASQMAKPCALATFTTALGFGSLAVSEVGPVRDLGLYTAIGAFWVLAAVFFLVPLVVSRAPITGGNKTLSRSSLERYAERLLKWRALILLSGTVLFAGLSAGLPKLQLESNVMTFFHSEHPLPHNYADFEKDFFGLTSFEILMEGPLGRVCSERSLEILDHLEETALEKGLARESLSPWLDKDEEHSLADRALALRGVFQEIPEEVEKYAWRGGTTGVIRMTLTSPTGSSNQAYESVRALRDEIARLDYPGALNLTVGGAAPLLVRGQVLLLDTQVRSFATALLSITLVIVVAYRSWRLTALSLICNVFPVAGTLGLMGWFGVPLNAGTVTVAGIALGLIVDDTIHVIHSFAEARDRPPLEAIVTTLHGSGKPILITSVAVALGFGLFGFAAFQPTRYFGLLTALTSLLALFADLVILPALLLRRDQPERDLSSS